MMIRHLTLVCVLMTSATGAQAQRFFNLHASCPTVGKHKDKNTGRLVKYSMSSDEGLRNMAKRHRPVDVSPTTLTLADFRALQDQVNGRFADAARKKTKFAPTRDALQQFKVSAGRVSEGEMVQVAAFVKEVRPSGLESSNCVGVDGKDIHINIGEGRSNEFKGVVVEMIPQLPRPKGWDTAMLNSLKPRRGANQPQVLADTSVNRRQNKCNLSTSRSVGQVIGVVGAALLTLSLGVPRILTRPRRSEAQTHSLDLETKRLT